MTEIIRSIGWRWSRTEVRKNVFRALFLAAGLVLLAWVAHRADADRVLAVVRSAAPWMPVLVLLEFAVIATDVAAIHALLGPASTHVRTRVWLRSSAVAYFSSALLPAGRAAGEAARAAVISPAVGASRAIVAAFRLQACALIANAAMSALSLLALELGPSDRRLTIALVANAVVCLALGTSFLALGGNQRIGRWLRTRFPGRQGSVDPSPHHESKVASLFRAGLLCVVGRLVQTVQCGVLLSAVGSSIDTRRAMVAEGIRLVGAATGDFIPNQLGATEGAYFVFSNVLGLAEAARSVSIPILTHAVQLFVAAICLMVVAATPTQNEREDA